MATLKVNTYERLLARSVLEPVAWQLQWHPSTGRAKMLSAHKSFSKSFPQKIWDRVQQSGIRRCLQPRPFDRSDRRGPESLGGNTELIPRILRYL